jgi:hypothetical protein
MNWEKHVATIMELATRFAVYTLVITLFDYFVDTVVFPSNVVTMLIIAIVMAIIGEGRISFILLWMEFLRVNRARAWANLLWNLFLFPPRLECGTIWLEAAAIVALTWIGPMIGWSIQIPVFESIALAHLLSLTRLVHDIVIHAIMQKYVLEQQPNQRSS